MDDERPHRTKDTAPLFSTDTPLEQEIGRLFRWSLLNTRDNLPDSIRDFLKQFLESWYVPCPRLTGQADAVGRLRCSVCGDRQLNVQGVLGQAGSDALRPLDCEPPGGLEEVVEQE